MNKTIWMKKSTYLSLFASACLLATTVNAQSVATVPNLGGSWTITGYFEPNLGSPYTYCFNFTTNPNSVLFPNSGTWKVPSYSLGWNGTWYQDGDEIIFHGVADKTYLFSWKGRLNNPTSISGRQVEFLLDGSTDTAGTFIGTKVSSCSAASADETVTTMKSGKTDPAK
jgi:hypothetical protein